MFYIVLATFKIIISYNSPKCFFCSNSHFKTKVICTIKTHQHPKKNHIQSRVHFSTHLSQRTIINNTQNSWRIPFQPFLRSNESAAVRYTFLIAIHSTVKDRRTYINSPIIYTAYKERDLASFGTTTLKAVGAYDYQALKWYSGNDIKRTVRGTHTANWAFYRECSIC